MEDARCRLREGSQRMLHEHDHSLSRTAPSRAVAHVRELLSRYRQAALDAHSRAAFSGHDAKNDENKSLLTRSIQGRKNDHESKKSTQTRAVASPVSKASSVSKFASTKQAVCVHAAIDAALSLPRIDRADRSSGEGSAAVAAACLATPVRQDFHAPQRRGEFGHIGSNVDAYVKDDATKTKSLPLSVTQGHWVRAHTSELAATAAREKRLEMRKGQLSSQTQQSLFCTNDSSLVELLGLLDFAQECHINAAAAIRLGRNREACEVFLSAVANDVCTLRVVAERLVDPRAKDGLFTELTRTQNSRADVSRATNVAVRNDVASTSSSARGVVQPEDVFKDIVSDIATASETCGMHVGALLSKGTRRRREHCSDEGLPIALRAYARVVYDDLLRSACAFYMAAEEHPLSMQLPAGAVTFPDDKASRSNDNTMNGGSRQIATTTVSASSTAVIPSDMRAQKDVWARMQDGMRGVWRVLQLLDTVPSLHAGHNSMMDSQSGTRNSNSRDAVVGYDSRAENYSVNDAAKAHWTLVHSPATASSSSLHHEGGSGAACQRIVGVPVAELLAVREHLSQNGASRHGSNTNSQQYRSCEMRNKIKAHGNSSSNGGSIRKSKNSEITMPTSRVYNVGDALYHITFSATVYWYEMAHRLIQMCQGSACGMSCQERQAALTKSSLLFCLRGTAFAIRVCEGCELWWSDDTYHHSPRQALPVQQGQQQQQDKTDSCIHAANSQGHSPLQDTVCGSAARKAGQATCSAPHLKLATVKYLPWRLRLYELVMQCYEQLHQYDAALRVAQRATEHIAQLTRIEFASDVLLPYQQHGESKRATVPRATRQILQSSARRAALCVLRYRWLVQVSAPSVPFSSVGDARAEDVRDRENSADKNNNMMTDCNSSNNKSHQNITSNSNKSRSSANSNANMDNSTASKNEVEKIPEDGVSLLARVWSTATHDYLMHVSSESLPSTPMHMAQPKEAFHGHVALRFICELLTSCSYVGTVAASALQRSTRAGLRLLVTAACAPSWMNEKDVCHRREFMPGGERHVSAESMSLAAPASQLPWGHTMSLEALLPEDDLPHDAAIHTKKDKKKYRNNSISKNDDSSCRNAETPPRSSGRSASATRTGGGACKGNVVAEIDASKSGSKDYTPLSPQDSPVADYILLLEAYHHVVAEASHSPGDAEAAAGLMACGAVLCAALHDSIRDISTYSGMTTTPTSVERVDRNRASVLARVRVIVAAAVSLLQHVLYAKTAPVDPAELLAHETIQLNLDKMTANTVATSAGQCDDTDHNGNSNGEESRGLNEVRRKETVLMRWTMCARALSQTVRLCTQGDLTRDPADRAAGELVARVIRWGAHRTLDGAAECIECANITRRTSNDSSSSSSNRNSNSRKLQQQQLQSQGGNRKYSSSSAREEDAADTTSRTNDAGIQSNTNSTPKEDVTHTRRTRKDGEEEGEDMLRYDDEYDLYVRTATEALAALFSTELPPTLTSSLDEEEALCVRLLQLVNPLVESHGSAVVMMLSQKQQQLYQRHWRAGQRCLPVVTAALARLQQRCTILSSKLSSSTATCTDSKLARDELLVSVSSSYSARTSLLSQLRRAADVRTALAHAWVRLRLSLSRQHTQHRIRCRRAADVAAVLTRQQNVRVYGYPSARERRILTRLLAQRALDERESARVADEAPDSMRHKTSHDNVASTHSNTCTGDSQYIHSNENDCTTLDEDKGKEDANASYTAVERSLWEWAQGNVSRRALMSMCVAELAGPREAPAMVRQAVSLLRTWEKTILGQSTLSSVINSGRSDARDSNVSMNEEQEVYSLRMLWCYTASVSAGVGRVCAAESREALQVLEKSFVEFVADVHKNCTDSSAVRNTSAALSIDGAAESSTTRWTNSSNTNKSSDAAALLWKRKDNDAANSAVLRTALSQAMLDVAWSELRTTQMPRHHRVATVDYDMGDSSSSSESGEDDENDLAEDANEERVLARRALCQRTGLRCAHRIVFALRILPALTTPRVSFTLTAAHALLRAVLLVQGAGDRTQSVHLLQPLTALCYTLLRLVDDQSRLLSLHDRHPRVAQGCSDDCSGGRIDTSLKHTGMRHTSTSGNDAMNDSQHKTNTVSCSLWSRAEVQLLALRGLTAVRDSLAYMTSSLSASDGVSVVDMLQLPARYRLLYKTFARVWNATCRAPCPAVRQHRACIAAQARHARAQMYAYATTTCAMATGSALSHISGDVSHASARATVPLPTAFSRADINRTDTKASAATNAANATSPREAAEGVGLADTSTTAKNTPCCCCDGRESHQQRCGEGISTSATVCHPWAHWMHDPAHGLVQDQMPVEYVELLEQLVFAHPRLGARLLRRHRARRVPASDTHSPDRTPRARLTNNSYPSTNRSSCTIKNSASHETVCGGEEAFVYCCSVPRSSKQPHREDMVTSESSDEDDNNNNYYYHTNNSCYDDRDGAKVRRMSACDARRGSRDAAHDVYYFADSEDSFAAMSCCVQGEDTRQRWRQQQKARRLRWESLEAIPSVLRHVCRALSQTSVNDKDSASSNHNPSVYEEAAARGVVDVLAQHPNDPYAFMLALRCVIYWSHMGEWVSVLTLTRHALAAMSRQQEMLQRYMPRPLWAVIHTAQQQEEHIASPMRAQQKADHSNNNNRDDNHNNTADVTLNKVDKGNSVATLATQSVDCSAVRDTQHNARHETSYSSEDVVYTNCEFETQAYDDAKSRESAAQQQSKRVLVASWRSCQQWRAWRWLTRRWRSFVTPVRAMLLLYSAYATYTQAIERVQWRRVCLDAWAVSDWVSQIGCTWGNEENDGNSSSAATCATPTLLAGGRKGAATYTSVGRGNRPFAGRAIGANDRLNNTTSSGTNNKNNEDSNSNEENVLLLASPLERCARAATLFNVMLLPDLAVRAVAIGAAMLCASRACTHHTAQVEQTIYDSAATEPHALSSVLASREKSRSVSRLIAELLAARESAVATRDMLTGVLQPMAMRVGGAVTSNTAHVRIPSLYLSLYQPSQTNRNDKNDNSYDDRSKANLTHRSNNTSHTRKAQVLQKQQQQPAPKCKIKSVHEPAEALAKTNAAVAIIAAAAHTIAPNGAHTCTGLYNFEHERGTTRPQRRAHIAPDTTNRTQIRILMHLLHVLSCTDAAQCVLWVHALIDFDKGNALLDPGITDAGSINNVSGINMRSKSVNEVLCYIHRFAGLLRLVLKCATPSILTREEKEVLLGATQAAEAQACCSRQSVCSSSTICERARVLCERGRDVLARFSRESLRSKDARGKDEVATGCVTTAQSACPVKTNKLAVARMMAAIGKVEESAPLHNVPEDSQMENEGRFSEKVQRAEEYFLAALDLTVAVPHALQQWRALAQGINGGDLASSSVNTSITGQSVFSSSAHLPWKRILCSVCALGELARGVYLFHGKLADALTCAHFAAVLLSSHLPVRAGGVVSYTEVNFTSTNCASSSSSLLAAAAEAAFNDCPDVVTHLLFLTQLLLEHASSETACAAVVTSTLAECCADTIVKRAEARVYRATAASLLGNVRAAMGLLLSVCQGTVGDANVYCGRARPPQQLLPMSFAAVCHVQPRFISRMCSTTEDHDANDHYCHGKSICPTQDGLDAHRENDTTTTTSSSRIVGNGNTIGSESEVSICGLPTSVSMCVAQSARDGADDNYVLFTGATRIARKGSDGCNNANSSNSNSKDSSSANNCNNSVGNKLTSSKGGDRSLSHSEAVAMPMLYNNHASPTSEFNVRAVEGFICRCLPHWAMVCAARGYAVTASGTLAHTAHHNASTLRGAFTGGSSSTGSGNRHHLSSEEGGWCAKSRWRMYLSSNDSNHDKIDGNNCGSGCAIFAMHETVVGRLGVALSLRVILALAQLLLRVGAAAVTSTGSSCGGSEAYMAGSASLDTHIASPCDSSHQADTHVNSKNNRTNTASNTEDKKSSASVVALRWASLLLDLLTPPSPRAARTSSGTSTSGTAAATEANTLAAASRHGASNRRSGQRLDSVQAAGPHVGVNTSEEQCLHAHSSCNSGNSGEGYDCEDENCDGTCDYYDTIAEDEKSGSITEDERRSRTAMWSAPYRWFVREVMYWKAVVALTQGHCSETMQMLAQHQPKDSTDQYTMRHRLNSVVAQVGVAGGGKNKSRNRSSTTTAVATPSQSSSMAAQDSSSASVTQARTLTKRMTLRSWTFLFGYSLWPTYGCRVAMLSVQCAVRARVGSSGSTAAMAAMLHGAREYCVKCGDVMYTQAIQRYALATHTWRLGPIASTSKNYNNSSGNEDDEVYVALVMLQSDDSSSGDGEKRSENDTKEGESGAVSKSGITRTARARQASATGQAQPNKVASQKQAARRSKTGTNATARTSSKKVPTLTLQHQHPQSMREKMAVTATSTCVDVATLTRVWGVLHKLLLRAAQAGLVWSKAGACGVDYSHADPENEININCSSHTVLPNAAMALTQADMGRCAATQHAASVHAVVNLCAALHEARARRVRGANCAWALNDVSVARVCAIWNDGSYAQASANCRGSGTLIHTGSNVGANQVHDNAFCYFHNRVKGVVHESACEVEMVVWLLQHAICTVAPRYDTATHPSLLLSSKLQLARVLLMLHEQKDGKRDANSWSRAPTKDAKQTLAGQGNEKVTLHRRRARGRWCAQDTLDWMDQLDGNAWQPELQSRSSASASGQARKAESCAHSRRYCAAKLLLEVVQGQVQCGIHDYAAVRVALRELAALALMPMEGCSCDDNNDADAIHCDDSNNYDNINNRVHVDERSLFVSSAKVALESVSAGCVILCFLVQDMIRHVFRDLHAFTDYTAPNALATVSKSPNTATSTSGSYGGGGGVHKSPRGGGNAAGRRTDDNTNPDKPVTSSTTTTSTTTTTAAASTTDTITARLSLMLDDARRTNTLRRCLPEAVVRAIEQTMREAGCGTASSWQSELSLSTSLSEKDNRDTSGGSAAEKGMHVFYTSLRAASLGKETSARAHRLGNNNSSSNTNTSSNVHANAVLNRSVEDGMCVTLQDVVRTFARQQSERALYHTTLLLPRVEAQIHETHLRLVRQYLQERSAGLNCTYCCYTPVERNAALEQIYASLYALRQGCLGNSIPSSLMTMIHSSGCEGYNAITANSTGRSRRNNNNNNNISANNSNHASTSSNNKDMLLSSSNATMMAMMALAEEQMALRQALVPPLLISALPRSFFTPDCASALGAPLLNSVFAQSWVSTVASSSHEDDHRDVGYAVGCIPEMDESDVDEDDDTMMEYREMGYLQDVENEKRKSDCVKSASSVSPLLACVRVTLLAALSPLSDAATVHAPAITSALDRSQLVPSTRTSNNNDDTNDSCNDNRPVSTSSASSPPASGSNRDESSHALRGAGGGGTDGFATVETHSSSHKDTRSRHASRRRAENVKDRRERRTPTSRSVAEKRNAKSSMHGSLKNQNNDNYRGSDDDTSANEMDDADVSAPVSVNVALADRISAVAAKAGANSAAAAAAASEDVSTEGVRVRELSQWRCLQLDLPLSAVHELHRRAQRARELMQSADDLVDGGDNNITDSVTTSHRVGHVSVDTHHRREGGGEEKSGAHAGRGRNGLHDKIGARAMGAVAATRLSSTTLAKIAEGSSDGVVSKVLLSGQSATGAGGRGQEQLLHALTRASVVLQHQQQTRSNMDGSAAFFLDPVHVTPSAWGVITSLSAASAPASASILSASTSAGAAALSHSLNSDSGLNPIITTATRTSSTTTNASPGAAKRASPALRVQHQQHQRNDNVNLVHDNCSSSSSSSICYSSNSAKDGNEGVGMTLTQQQQQERRRNRVDVAKSAFVMALVETIVRRYAKQQDRTTSVTTALLDEDTMERLVAKVLPRSLVTIAMLDFFVQWFDVKAETVDCQGECKNVSDGMRYLRSVSGDGGGGGAVRVFDFGLHDWLMRVYHFVHRTEELESSN